MIGGNQYIRDFLKFILIRDQRLRPSIDKVIKRFEHIHAILCNVGCGPSSPEKGPSDFKPNQQIATDMIRGNSEMQQCLHAAAEITKSDKSPNNES